MLDLDCDQRERLLQVVIGGADSPEAWLEARILLLAAQPLSVEEISATAGVDPETVRSVVESLHHPALSI